ncbi:MAG: Hpt domain-containing protein [Bdellovibrionota bacterium]
MSTKDLLRLDPLAKTNLKSLQIEDEVDIYQQFVEIFLKTSDEFLGSLKTANISIAQRVSHSWRSSSSVIGAQILANLCLQIETCSDSKKYKELIVLVESEYKEVRAQLIQSQKAG